MVLCSLLKQLVLQMPEFPNALEVLYDSLVKSEKRPGLEEIFALLVGGVRTAFESVYIVCDALDECDPQTQRSALLPLLKRMAAQGCRVLVTSRPHPEDIQDAFSEDAGKIELLAQAEDLRSYVQARIDSSGRARRIIRGSRYEDEIISELVSSAKGMFLLVQFHIDHLCQLTTVKQVRQELAKLKQDAMEERPLDPTYDRAVELLRSQGRFEVQLALKILLWITKAPRPLLVDELRIAVAIEAGEYELDYDEDIPSVSTLTDVCAGLVDIDENGKAIRLIHYTAQEYLVRKGIIPDSSTDPEFNIALSCITYLSFTAFSDGNTSIEAISSSPPNKNHTHVRQFLKRSPDTQHLLHTHPFLHYASTNLSFHLHQHPQSPATTTQAFLHFLSLPGNIATYFRTLTFQTREHYAFRGLESHPACVAAVIGHLPALLHLAAAATADHNGRTALSWAARHGHADIVNHLLRLTSPEDINAADSYHKTPLIHAAHFGNLEIVQALLQHGAAVDAKDLDGWTPLLWASQWGHEGVVRVLLDHGADPDVKDRAGWSALSWACKEGFGGVVRALLEKADVRRVDFPAAKPVLDWAAEKGESEVWEVLMRRWRQIEMVEGQM
ncbi:ankyrin repeat-containing domain protein [Sphaerosporella brunnea]|uniref:Ankyrin repeat-containing domain protein n=1 Tax=Sphaerosporella brunnea TaxID=1250544 RepID=A0A5J5EC20_9PEZI|nr:ankyrin repeat-containing domain protein [Sphaerosporella brunnea]